MRGFFITGTGTEIGKTIVTSILSFGLSKLGIKNCPVKPIASGGVTHSNQPVSEDALIYQQIAKTGEPLTVLNPFCLEYPASPHLAAEMENSAIPIEWIIDEIEKTGKQYNALLVEGVGGWLVPINHQMLVRDFAKQIGLPILLVSANELGTINHTLLTIESVRSSGQTVAGIIFTNPKPIADNRIHQDNIQTIERLSGTRILGNVPHLSPELLGGLHPEQLWQCIKDTIQWDVLIQQPGLAVKK